MEGLKISNKLKKTKLTSDEEDSHFIDKEDCLSNCEDKEVEKIEAKKTSKLKASKPLLLVRT